MEYNALETLREILLISNIPTVVLKEDQTNLHMIDNGFRMQIYENCQYNSVLEFCRLRLTPGMIMQGKDKYQLFYFYLSVPERFLAHGDTPYLFIGPVLVNEIPQSGIRQIMRQNQIPEHFLPDLSLFYSMTPVIGNPEAFAAVLQSLISHLFQESYRSVIFPEYDHVLREFDPSPDETSYRTEEGFLIAERIAECCSVENEMLKAISIGDYDTARACHQRLCAFQLPPAGSDPVKNARSSLSALNAIARKAAESGGVHPYYATDLSYRFDGTIQDACDIRELRQLSGEIIHKYCILVKNHTMRGCSETVRQIISYIDFHYMEDLTLTSLSEMFHLTRTYLSGLFKKETGVGLTEYIHQIRMRKAITLINTTSMSVTEIASACGYNDSNYFFRIFKKTYGISPKQYQKSISTLSGPGSAAVCEQNGQAHLS